MSIETITYHFVSEDITKSIFFIVSTLACIILTFKIWVSGDWSKPSKIDLVSLAFCIVSILVFLFFQSIWFAHLIILIAIPIGFFPSFSNALENYQNENSKAWYCWAISDFIMIIVILMKLNSYKELPFAIIEFLSHIAIISFLLFGKIKTMKGGYIIKINQFGKGVYTTKPFLRGDIILKFEGKRIFINDEIKEKLGGPIDHYLQIDDNLYIGPSGKADDYVNHSCNPNTGLRFKDDDIFLIGLTDINENTEITFDYSTCTLSAEFKMPCFCSEKNCREFIGDFDELDEKLQQKYIDMDIVAPFAKKALVY